MEESRPVDWLFGYLSAVQVPFVDLNAIHNPLNEELKATFDQVLNEAYFVYGKQVTEFENAFAEKLGVRHCLAVGNCTDALSIVLKMMGVGPCDEVLVPAMTWITDAEVVSNLGAQPVFVDVDAESCLIDVEQIEEKINKKTKAVIPVHLFGQMANMDAISELAQTYDLKVVEDCAQAHFASQHDAIAGTRADAAVFSFYPTKNLGALGDAGAIVTRDQSLYKACRKMANHGALDKHSHEFPGANSRIDTLQAAILKLKLQYIDNWNEQRRQLALKYSGALAHIPELVCPKTLEGNKHVFHVYAIKTTKRDELKSYLKEQGIYAQIHYPEALPFTRAYSHLQLSPEDFPMAYQWQKETLSLPLFPGMTEEQQAYVIEHVEKFFQ